MKIATVLTAAAGTLLLVTSAPAEADFDIRAEFMALPPCTVKEDCVIRIRLTNDGPDASPANRVSLNRYNGKAATGYATRVGGSAALLALPSLPKGESITLTFVDPRIRAGTFTYQPRYASPLNDRNGANHRITRTVTY